MPEKSFEKNRDAVLALNDEQLKQAVHNLAAAGGMDARRADAVSRDPEKLRKKLSSVSERDIEKMLAQIPPEQLRAIAEQLKNL
ncbi:MAG: hypothetical protein IJ449_08410 [Clostridia bacterium]|nr:hypothetical protein [Clostridia bacterium]